jgi:hypothetical protein
MELIMKVSNMLTRMVLLVSIMIMGVWSCAGRPFDPPQADEIPKGPGVFTKGVDGAVLYDSNKERLPAVSPSQTPATFSGGSEQPAAESEYEDYEGYRQWLRWKKSAVGTPEYEEFQQWREWRKYQEWKKQK